MTIAGWLVNAMVKLQEAEIPNGRTDALILLSDLFKQDKSWVHAHPEFELNDEQLKLLNLKLNKRINRLPLAYIRGWIEFYGRRFSMNTRVLAPRPESESFIDLIKTIKVSKPRIADIGTGSGVLGITTALEIPGAIVHLYDIDSDALKVARKNSQKYGLDLPCFQSNLLSDIQSESYDILMANLPYVPDGMVTSPEISQEPPIALFSGKDGLDHYRQFWQQVNELKNKPKYILTESLENQHPQIIKTAEICDYKLLRSDILVQLFKC